MFDFREGDNKNFGSHLKKKIQRLLKLNDDDIQIKTVNLLFLLLTMRVNSQTEMGKARE